MSEQMARSKANDTRDPNNFPEDNGLRLCNECGEHHAVDLTNAKEAEVEGFDSCYQHLSTVEELKEECFNKGRSIDRLAKELKEKDGTITELNKELSFQKGLVNDLHVLLNESLLRFDRLNRVTQNYENKLNQ